MDLKKLKRDAVSTEHIVTSIPRTQRSFETMKFLVFSSFLPYPFVLHGRSSCNGSTLFVDSYLHPALNKVFSCLFSHYNFFDQGRTRSFTSPQAFDMRNLKNDIAIVLGATALFINSVDAHAYMTSPKMSWLKTLQDQTAFVVAVQSNETGWTGPFNGPPRDNTKNFWTGFKTSKFKNIRELVRKMGK